MIEGHASSRLDAGGGYTGKQEGDMSHHENTKCPVCGMEVRHHDHEAIFQQLLFTFCSEQCKARFLAHPNLYIGYPGQPAPKQEGQVVLKHRRIPLVQPLSVEGAELVQELLGGLMGVSAVIVSGDTIEVTYDLLQVSLAEMEAVLSGAGISSRRQLGGIIAPRLDSRKRGAGNQWP